MGIFDCLVKRNLTLLKKSDVPVKNVMEQYSDDKQTAKKIENICLLVKKKDRQKYKF